MADAGIRHGDLVYFGPVKSREAARGKIVVIRVNASIYLKYYHEVGDQTILLGGKLGSEPLIIKPEDDVELYGIVIPSGKR